MLKNWSCLICFVIIFVSGLYSQSTQGSGFAISSNGYIATNYHVIEGGNQIRVMGIKGDFSTLYEAKVVLTDEKNDLAIVKVSNVNLGTIPYTFRKTMASVGESIFVLGYPLTSTMGDDIKLTDGLISSKSGFSGDVTMYQISAPIQPGNSGGPLFDKSGNLIGIICAKHREAENASYAVKLSYLLGLIETLSTPPTLPSSSLMAGQSLPQQVKLASKFVYQIIVDNGVSADGNSGRGSDINRADRPKIEWVNIPAGTFTMGSPSYEAYSWDKEGPQHSVSLSGFKMSKYEVTFAQYDAFCGAAGRLKPNDEGWGRGNRPVINVDWNDATAFAQWMGCRLPTEAEWEYACRAGTTSPFNTGSCLGSSQANYDGNYPYTTCGKGTYLQKTMPVGSYAPNAWGLYDMHGNVWEWCSDWLGDYSSSPQNNPKGPSSGSYRVLRGGGWRSHGGHYCRSATRLSDEPSHRNGGRGFRLVVPD